MHAVYVAASNSSVPATRQVRLLECLRLVLPLRERPE